MGVADKSSPKVGLMLQLHYTLPRWLRRVAGAPRRLVLSLRVPPTSEVLHLALVAAGKTPTRLPESLWLRFAPPTASADPGSWLLHKLGTAISPSTVLLNGSAGMHAVDDLHGAVVSAQPPRRETLAIVPLDAALVSPGTPALLPKVVRSPRDVQGGVAFNLLNNAWGTNYVRLCLADQLVLVMVSQRVSVHV